jgi:hypothetical protein
MSSRSKEPQELSRNNRVGGIAFFVSLIFLCLLATLNSLTLIAMQESGTVLRWVAFTAAGAVGFFLAHRFSPERFAVFVHELKHSIVSNLAGNRAKRFKVQDRSGSFTYEYTKQTAAYNAFIALAPYWFPLFSIVGIPSLVFLLSPVHPWAPTVVLLLAGILWGADCSFNLRDISPVQTDITGIRGGYRVGVLYIIAMNITLFSFLAAWVSRDIEGLYLLGKALWDMLHDLVTTLLAARGGLTSP